MHFKLKIGTVLLLLLLFVGCRKKNSQAKGNLVEKNKKELILAISTEPDDGFDPTTGWGRFGSPLFQSTLMTLNEKLEVVDNLTTDYSVSEDGLLWTLRLKEGIKFSDGMELLATDVVFTFEKAKMGRSVIDLTNVSKIEELDSQTVRFVLRKPDSNFLYQLTTLGIVPKHAYNESYAENPIGSGPYQLIQWDKGQQLIVKANPHYYGDKPYFDKLTFLFMDDDSGIAAAKAGHLDLVWVPSPLAKININGMALLSLKSVDKRGISFPFVEEGKENSVEGYPVGNNVTADKAIRKAINRAIDRQVFVQGTLNGYGKPAYNRFGSLPWWNPETDFEDADQKVAENILEDAGWKMNKKGIREKEGLEAKFDLYYVADDPTRQALALTFAEIIKPLGIQVRTIGKSWSEIERILYSNPVVLSSGTHYPIEVYNSFSSTKKGHGYSNPNFYSNPMVDGYLEKAIHAVKQEEALEYWKKAQWDGETGFTFPGDAAWVWLVELEHLYFVSDRLDIGEQKMQPHLRGWALLDNISKWRWKD